MRLKDQISDWMLIQGVIVGSVSILNNLNNCMILTFSATVPSVLANLLHLSKYQSQRERSKGLFAVAIRKLKP